MTSKIVWTSREWRQIAEHLVQNAVVPEEHGWRGHLIRAMNATLTKDRQRNPANLNNAKDILKPLMKTIITGPQHKPILPPEPRLSGAKDFSTEDLLIELARRIAPLFEPRKETHNSLVDRGFHPKHDPEPQSPSFGTVRLQVQIVGPRAEQQERLRQAAPHLALRFTLIEENPKLVESRGKSCIETILWTKFVNHAQQEAARRAGKVWYANGLEEIEARLRSYD